jgi:hypothetical protein
LTDNQKAGAEFWQPRERRRPGSGLIGKSTCQHAGGTPALPSLRHASFGFQNVSIFRHDMAWTMKTDF